MKTKFYGIFIILFLCLTAANTVIAENFELMKAYDINKNSEAVYAYDFNEDGIKEIVTASDKIYIFDIKGDEKLESKSLSGISKLYVADLDLDGSVEIIAVSSGRIYLLDRNLNKIKEFDASSKISGISVVNLIGDEKLEIAVGSSSGIVYILDSNLAKSLIHDIGSTISDIYSGDIDNDKKPEIITVGDEVYIIDNLDTLSKKDDLRLINNKIKYIKNIYVHDLYNNGVKYIFLGTTYNVYGINLQGEKIKEFKTYGEVYSVAVSDLDNDNVNEVIISSKSTGESANYIYIFDVLASVQQKFKTGKEANIIKISDINNDGKSEIVAGTNDNFVYVFDDKLNPLWQYKTGDKINSIYITDIDNDNYTEIIAGSDDHKVYVFKQVKEAKNGEEKENTAVTKTDIKNINKIQVYDIDNGGNDEIAVVYSNHVALIDKKFNLKFSYETKSDVTGIYIGDLNNDSYNEIVVSCAKGQIYAISRTGYLIFEEQKDAKITNMYSADLNNDGTGEIMIVTPLIDYETKVYCTEKCCPENVDRSHISPPPEGFVGSGVCILSSSAELEFVGNETQRVFYSELLYREYIENMSKKNYEIVSETREDLKDGRTKITITIREKFTGVVKEPGFEKGRVYIKSSIRAYEGEKLTLKWKYESDSCINDIYASDLNNDTYPEIIAGVSDNTVHVISKDGKLIKKYNTEEPVISVFAGDLDNDNYPEIIAGSEDWFIYAFNSSGSLWQYETRETVSSVFATDLDNDGNVEVIAWSLNNYLYSLDSKGNLISKNKTASNIRDISAIDIDDDNYREILLAGDELIVLNYEYLFYKPEISENISNETLREPPKKEILMINVTGNVTVIKIIENLTIINVTDNLVVINVTRNEITLNTTGHVSLINATDNTIFINAIGNILIINVTETLVENITEGNSIDLEPFIPEKSTISKLTDAARENQIIVLILILIICFAGYFGYKKRQEMDINLSKFEKETGGD